MQEDIFILVFGHGRGGTSAVMGLINSFPDINMGFEENLALFQNPVSDSFELSHEFNGNKIILPFENYLSFSKIVSCIETKKILLHSRFEKLKPVFVIRDPIDNLCSQYIRIRDGGNPKYEKLTLDMIVDYWIENTIIMNDLINFFGENYFGFDFYDFISQDKVKGDLLNWIGIKYSKEDLEKKVNVRIYGDNFLNMGAMWFGPENRKTHMVERKEIESLLVSKIGKDWRLIVPKF